MRRRCFWSFLLVHILVYSAHRHRSCGVDADLESQRESLGSADPILRLLSTKYVRIFPSCTYANDPNTAHLGQAASQATHLVCRQRYCGCLRENVSLY